MAEVVSFTEGSPLRREAGFIKKGNEFCIFRPLPEKLIDPFWLCPGYQQILYAGGTNDMLEPFRDGRRGLTACECFSYLY